MNNEKRIAKSGLPTKKFVTVNAHNYVLKDEHMEHNSGEIVVVPGEAYSIAELLAKHLQGNMPNVGRVPQYSGTDDYENTDPTMAPDFDLSDVSEITETVNEHYRRKREAEAEAKLKEQATKEQATKVEATEKAVFATENGR